MSYNRTPAAMSRKKISRPTPFFILKNEEKALGENLLLPTIRLPARKKPRLPPIVNLIN
jgi:hypothetical protein